jgi:hypothetical protein
MTVMRVQKSDQTEKRVGRYGPGKVWVKPKTLSDTRDQVPDPRYICQRQMRGLNTSPLDDSDHETKIRTNRKDAEWIWLRKDERESDCSQLFTPRSWIQLIQSARLGSHLPETSEGSKLIYSS